MRGTIGRTFCGILAFLLIVGAISGGMLNLEQIATGKGVPVEPHRRGPFIVGMFVPTIGCGAIGLWLAYMAIRPKPASRGKATKLEDDAFLQ